MLALGAEADVLGEFSFEGMLGDKIPVRLKFAVNGDEIAEVNGIPFSGTYVYNQQNGEIALKTATETIKGNVTKTAKGMGLMFDSTQMVNLLQKEGKVSNTAAVQAVSKLAKSADGARVGFELTK